MQYFETAINFQKSDPWSSDGLWAFGGNGDGSLLYPGTPSVIGGHTHVPVSSIRLKQIRDGYEDFEYHHRSIHKVFDSDCADSKTSSKD